MAENNNNNNTSQEGFIKSLDQLYTLEKKNFSKINRLEESISELYNSIDKMYSYKGQPYPQPEDAEMGGDGLTASFSNTVDDIVVKELLDGSLVQYDDVSYFRAIADSDVASWSVRAGPALLVEGALAAWSNYSSTQSEGPYAYEREKEAYMDPKEIGLDMALDEKIGKRSDLQDGIVNAYLNVGSGARPGVYDADRQDYGMETMTVDGEEAYIDWGDVGQGDDGAPDM